MEVFLYCQKDTILTTITCVGQFTMKTLMIDVGIVKKVWHLKDLKLGTMKQYNIGKHCRGRLKKEVLRELHGNISGGHFGAIKFGVYRVRYHEDFID